MMMMMMIQTSVGQCPPTSVLWNSLPSDSTDVGGQRPPTSVLLAVVHGTSLISFNSCFTLHASFYKITQLTQTSNSQSNVQMTANIRQQLQFMLMDETITQIPDDGLWARTMTTLDCGLCASSESIHVALVWPQLYFFANSLSGNICLKVDQHDLQQRMGHYVQQGTM